MRQYQMVHVIGVLEKKGEKRVEELFEEIMTDNFSKLMTDIKLEIQEIQRT